MFRFTIRDMLWLTVVVAILISWWASVRRQSADLQEVQTERIRFEIDNQVMWASHHRLARMYERATGKKVSTPLPAPDATAQE